VSWHAEAACAGLTSLFFREVKPSQQPAHNRQLKAICATCPVHRECLDEAVLNREEFYIWGGLTPTERRQRHRGGRSAYHVAIDERRNLAADIARKANAEGVNSRLAVAEALGISRQRSYRLLDCMEKAGYDLGEPAERAS
jgi:WhiB family redox-sensing transcriptional regulator